MKTWLFKPFTYVAGLKALLLGFLFMLATLIISFYSKTHFDGAIDAHVGMKAPLSIFAFEQLIAWGSMVLTSAVIAFFVARSSFRLIDIAGTMALSRAPMLLVAIIGFSPVLHITNPQEINIAVMAVAILMLVPVIWTIALMLHAFKTCTNLKGTKANLSFIAALLLAEIISISLNQLLIKPLLVK